MLTVSGVKKHFGGVVAVNHCSFEVAAGRITSLIGPNGAGKTTVFNCISGLVPMDAGTIRLAGRDITHESVWKRSRFGLSRTFQSSRLFKNLTVEDNLLLALRQDDDRFWRCLGRTIGASKIEHAAVRDALERVGLMVNPHVSVTTLSYGQQKLFDLARALLNPHCLLILDEPVAGVNPVIREQLKQVLHTLKAGGETVLVIEHDMDFIRSVADHVIVMVEGRVLIEGEPKEVLADARVLEAYLGASRAL